MSLTKKYHLRLAEHSELQQIWEIIEAAKQQMYREGKQQWDENYPTIGNISNDIAHHYGYVLCDETQIVAYAAVVFDGEPTYEAIKGKWLSNNPYIVVHRLAVAESMKQKGIAFLFMKEIEKLCFEKEIRSFKVDTNFDNVYMQKLLSKCGFSYCGEIIYQHGSRMAYEKILC